MSTNIETVRELATVFRPFLDLVAPTAQDPVVDEKFFGNVTLTYRGSAIAVHFLATHDGPFVYVSAPSAERFVSLGYLLGLLALTHERPWAQSFNSIARLALENSEQIVAFLSAQQFECRWNAYQAYERCANMSRVKEMMS